MRSRLGPLFAITILLSGCAGPPAPSRGPARSDLSIEPENAEVWAWTIAVRGALESGTARLAACRIVTGETSFPARVDGTTFSAAIRLRPGPNRVRGSCVDEAGAAHESPEAEYEARLRDAPVARIGAELRGRELILDATPAAPSEGTPSPLAAFSWTAESAGRQTPLGCAGRTSLLVPPGGTTVRLTVRDALARTDESAVSVVEQDGRLALVDSRRFGVGPRAKSAVLYGVVPRLYGPDPLRAVTRALPDLADLGVTALWLSPIFATPSGDYGYAVTDYLRVRPDYGTEDDLRALVAEAHRRGLAVLLDLVPNHTSAKHRYFREAQALGPASHTFRFYQRDPAGNAVHYFDWTHLPNLAYGEGEVRRWILAVTAHWLRDFDVDGYRVDAAWGIRERAPDFWNEWRAEARRIEPEAILVAEASARDPFYADDFDAAYDWTDEPGKAAWEHAFDEPDAIAERLDAAVRAARVHPLTFLENNDTGRRFVTRHGADLARAAAAALLTLPGMPCLFTGEERGEEYEPYARAEPLPPGDPHALRPWHRALISLRRSVPALRGTGYERVRPSPDDPRVYAYVRRGALPDEVALVVLRFDARPAAVRIAAPAGARSWRDLLSGAVRPTRDGMLEVDVPAWGAAILVPAEARKNRER